MTRLALALNVGKPDLALQLLDRIGNQVDCYKLQMDLFGRAGPDLVREFVKRGASVFLDLKFHDIPSVVANSVSAAAELQVSLLTIHACGGEPMIRAAVDAAHKAEGRRPLILAVTVLTSLSAADLRETFGSTDSVQERALALACLAKKAGCDGVVCSPQELTTIKMSCGKDFLAVCPGIRLEPGQHGSPCLAGEPTPARDDQVRIGTPAQAARDGADYIVVGRPIYEAECPLEVISQIKAQLGER